MNKQRKKEIGKNIDSLKDVKSNLEKILFDEEMYYDNMPENLQGSIRGEDSQTAIDILTDVVGTLDDVINSLLEI